MTPDVASTAEVARMLRRSIRTVHRMAATGQLDTVGKLPGTRGAYLFDREYIARVADQAASA